MGNAMKVILPIAAIAATAYFAPTLLGSAAAPAAGAAGASGAAGAGVAGLTAAEAATGLTAAELGTTALAADAGLTGAALGGAEAATYGEAMMLPSAIAEAPAEATGLSGIGKLFSGITPMQAAGAGALGSTLLGSLTAADVPQPDYGQLNPVSGTGVGGPAAQAKGDFDPYSDDAMRRRLASLQGVPDSTTLGGTLG